MYKLIKEDSWQLQLYKEKMNKYSKVKEEVFRQQPEEE